MTYALDFTETALRDLAWLKRHEPAAYRKALRLADELRAHPTTGTGRPEQLKGDRAGCWSRRISSKHQRRGFSTASPRPCGSFQMPLATHFEVFDS